MKLNESQDADYKNLVDLLSVYSEASNRMEALQTEANEEYLTVIDDKKTEYARLQKIISEAELSLELIARRHPEWFKEKKTVRTPYGSVRLTATEKLEIANEEVAVLLIEQEGERNPDFKAENYLRKEIILNREALETLDDQTLKRFRIKRVPGESFAAKAAKVDMGTALKTDDKSKQEAS